MGELIELRECSQCPSLIHSNKDFCSDACREAYVKELKEMLLEFGEEPKDVKGHEYLLLVLVIYVGVIVTLFKWAV